MYEMVSFAERLVSYVEVRAICFSLFLMLILLAVFVLIVIMLHVWFRMRGASKLYEGRKPIPHWDRQFYPASVALSIFILIVSWFLYQFAQGIVPFAP